MKKKNDETCVWVDDPEVEGGWEGTCKIRWCFEDGGPKENGVVFCPHCGKKVEVKG